MESSASASLASSSSDPSPFSVGSCCPCAVGGRGGRGGFTFTAAVFAPGFEFEDTEPMEVTLGARALKNPPNETGVKINYDDYVVVNVGPSIVPAYLPSVRVFRYNITQWNGHKVVGDEPVAKDEDEEEDEAAGSDEEDEDSEPDGDKKKKGSKRHHGHRYYRSSNPS